VFKDLLKKYIGSTRLFFSLLSFITCLVIVVISFFKDINLSRQQVTLLLGLLGNAIIYVAAETHRKSE